MKNFVKISLYMTFVLMFVGFAQAQKIRNLTGTVVDEIFSNKWSAVVIKVGAKKYGVQTEFMASFGDEKDGAKSWMIKATGNISKGKTVQVFYTKIDNTFDYGDVNNWLKATKIVEVKRSKVRKK